MLAIEPGSSCDVCAEEFGPRKLPASIPCGHVLCASCCNTICEKTSIRLVPVCPFCREQFSHDTIRIIRLDLNAPVASGSSTPLNPRSPTRSPYNPPKELPFPIREDDSRPTEMDCLRARVEARRLEDKVAKVAAKKCSVEEVSTLHRELQAWLTTDVDCKSDGQTASLSLSAALLRAILMNHVAHTEANKAHKSAEANLKEKLDESEGVRVNLEAELRRQQAQYAMKAQECQSLRAELNRLKVSAAGASIGLSSTPQPTHMRSQSVSHISPPQTPSPSSAGASAAAAMARASTPGPLSARYTSPTRTPSIHSSVSRTMTPVQLPQRSATPGARMVAPNSSSSFGVPPMPSPLKPRRNSNPVAPKILRSPSDDREAQARAAAAANAQMHARWIPSETPPARPESVRPRSPPIMRPFNPFGRTGLASRAMSPPGR